MSLSAKTFHIEQEAVVANTRKMRALWTLEASQDLKAYHNLDLERELTDLLSKELQLEIDRELIEDLRLIAYGVRDRNLGGVNQNLMDNSYITMGSQGTTFPGIEDSSTTGVFVPAQFTYDFSGAQGTGSNTQFGPNSKLGQESSNIFVCDFSQATADFAPRHVGEVLRIERAQPSLHLPDRCREKLLIRLVHRCKCPCRGGELLSSGRAHLPLRLRCKQCEQLLA